MRDPDDQPCPRDEPQADVPPHPVARYERPVDRDEGLARIDECRRLIARSRVRAA